MKQLALFAMKISKEFGGRLLKKGKRKTLRPLQLSAPTHLVLKADSRIQLFRNSKTIKGLLKKYSHRFGVAIYSVAVQEDHIHAVVKFSSHRLYRAWIRALTSALCYAIKGLKWRLGPYTKFLTWGKQLKGALRYLQANRNQAEFLKQSWDRFGQFENEINRWIKVIPRADQGHTLAFSAGLIKLA